MSLTDLPQTLPQWLSHNASLRAETVGQRHKRDGVWREFTWRTIAEEVRALAFGLAARNVGRGNSVLIISENRPEQYWAELAALSLGAKIIAIYPDATEAEIDYIVEDSGAICIFAEDQEQVDKALPVAARHRQVHTIVWWEPGGMWSYRDANLISWDALKGSGEPLAAQEPGRVEQSVLLGRSSDIALLTYTSGTTGKPKGVITTQASLQHNARLLADALGTTAGCEYLSYIPLSWATEQWIGVTLGLMQPLCVNFAERPDQIQSAIRELACGMVFFGPRQWESMATLVHTRMADAPRWRQVVVDWAVGVGRRTRVATNEGRPIVTRDRILLPLAEALVLRPLREQLGLKNARIAMTGGAAIAPDVFRLFAAMGVTLRNVYGCSEFGLITVHHVQNPVNVETVGTPTIAGSQWGKPLEWRLTEAGELQVRGGAGFAGYWGKQDKTVERMDGDWYRTGDAMTQVAGKDELVYLDRLDHLSRLAGGQTYPKQFIESRLRFSPYIKEVMVVGDERHNFVTALVNVDGEVLARWAEREALSFTTFTDLSQRPEVVARIGREIDRVNTALPDHAKVLRFANLPKELDADEGELTRTRKLKREVIEERYSVLIEALYGAQDRVATEIPVRYQDGRSGVLRAEVLFGGEAFASKEAA
ncbi:MAG: long-chain fatty acid--CoA ligase [Rhodocyclaceae bacterium]|nr:MAG: long-chain fatty acid--CoA ligase [Rhodocyclaceae bacterium]